MSNQYFLTTGEADKERLIILSQLYNPTALEFLPNPEDAIKAMFRSLKPGGILAYEANNIDQTNYFSVPYNPTVTQWHSYGPKMFKLHNCPLTFAYDDIYPIYQELGCKNIDVKVNQAILKTARDKSVYRLGLFSSSKTILENNLLTQQEIDEFMSKLVDLENSNTITGFYHNLLFCGVKSTIKRD